MGVLRAAESAIREQLLQANYPFPTDLLARSGKISHGENYRELPYWVLDYPRKFQTDATFAFRTMVWWGHESSCALQVGGSHVEGLNLGSIMDDFFFCLNKDPWEYHFAEDNYVKAVNLSLDDRNQHRTQYGFIKIARQSPLTDLKRLPYFASKTFCDALISLS